MNKANTLTNRQILRRYRIALVLTSFAFFSDIVFDVVDEISDGDHSLIVSLILKVLAIVVTLGAAIASGRAWMSPNVQDISREDAAVSQVMEAAGRAERLLYEIGAERLLDEDRR